jgi:Fe-S cluster assembly iron-binding protein IscA
MVQVSDKASEVIKEVLKDTEEPHSVRIVMSEGG